MGSYTDIYQIRCIDVVELKLYLLIIATGQAFKNSLMQLKPEIEMPKCSEAKRK